MRKTNQSRNVPPVGERYGNLTVIGHGGKYAGGTARWLCRCDCGQESAIHATRVAKGITRHCRFCTGLKGGIAPRNESRDMEFARLFREGKSYGKIAGLFSLRTGTVVRAIQRLREKGVSVARDIEMNAA